MTSYWETKTDSRTTQDKLWESDKTCWAPWGMYSPYVLLHGFSLMVTFVQRVYKAHHFSFNNYNPFRKIQIENYFWHVVNHTWRLCQEMTPVFPWIEVSIWLIVWLRFQSTVFPFRTSSCLEDKLAEGGCWGCFCEAAWMDKRRGGKWCSKWDRGLLPETPQGKVWCLVMKKLCANMPDSETSKANDVWNLGKGTWPTWLYQGALHLAFDGANTSSFPPRSLIIIIDWLSSCWTMDWLHTAIWL